MTTRVIMGDCRERLRELPSDSLDACVTDPPYGLGKEPDPLPMLAAWMRGDDYVPRGKGGFMNEAWDAFVPQPSAWREVYRVLKPGAHVLAFFGTRTYDIGVLALRLAGFEIRDMVAWLHSQGFPKHPTHLKPSIEPVVLARKPLAGTVEENRATWGTGVLAIDACRIGSSGGGQNGRSAGALNREEWRQPAVARSEDAIGRWPANVLHDGSPEVMEAFPITKSNSTGKGKIRGIGFGSTAEGSFLASRPTEVGSAARFFYQPKPTAREKGDDNTHPTVKGIALKRYLCRLITPPGGTILDPYLGSGTTLLAARAEGFSAVGIEREERYVQISERRLAAALRQGTGDLFEETA